MASVLRAAADDELSTEDRARLDAHLRKHPEDDARIEFERRLRTHCAGVMQTPAAPAALREKILSIAAGAEQHAESGFSDDTDHDALVDRIEERSRIARASYFGGKRRALIGAAAAVLLVVTGFSLFSQVTGTPTPAGPQTAGVGNGISLANFFAAEHDRCTKIPQRSDKFTVADLSRVPDAFASILGRVPAIPDFQAAGMVFRDMGECHAPGEGRSVHVRLETDGSACREGISVSLFIQQGRAPVIPEDEDRPLALMRCSDGMKTTIYAWHAGGMSYFLVSEQTACERLREAAGLGEPIASRGARR
ncbi:MAG: hypothetical protein JJU33_14720 [Phycisphaerales bacterium]|nr:hypothetical protein [Phycisphaerales bacterium]